MGLRAHNDELEPKTFAFRHRAHVRKVTSDDAMRACEISVHPVHCEIAIKHLKIVSDHSVLRTHEHCVKSIAHKHCNRNTLQTQERLSPTWRICAYSEPQKVGNAC